MKLAGSKSALKNPAPHTPLGVFMRTEFLCISVLRVASGPMVVGWPYHVIIRSEKKNSWLSVFAFNPLVGLFYRPF